MATMHEQRDRNPYVTYAPSPPVVALLRAVWAKRALLNQRERDIIHACLSRIQRWPLTEGQLRAAVAIGQAMGVGFDDPHYDPAETRGGLPRPAPMPTPPNRRKSAC